MSRKAVKAGRLSQTVCFLRVSRLLLSTIWVMHRERRRVIRAHAIGNEGVQPDVEVRVSELVKFRAMALKLGGLQDEVPAEPFSHVVSVIEEGLGQPLDQLFSSVETDATAAASLEQVHKAVLGSTGSEVAVKVQRPNIEQLVRMDLGSLKFVIRVITRFVNTGSFIDLKGVYQEAGTHRS